MKGVLYIVSTPIGNLEDITLRALRILKEVDVIAAEDTRHTLKLLNHYGISRPLIRYWGEKEKVDAEETLQRLLAGQSVALVSDAGTPGISDPGTVLIRQAIEQDIPVVTVPGPTALVSALSLSGFLTDEFVFLGFLPAKKAQRYKTLEDLGLEQRTIVIYEAPHRIIDTVSDMKEIMPDRSAVIVREITKMFEEVFRGTCSRLAEMIAGSKIAGEYVIVIEGKKVEKKLTSDDAVREIMALMKKGLSRKEAVRKTAEAYGLSKKALYDASLDA